MESALIIIDNKIKDYPSEIIPGFLFLGAFRHAWNFDVIAELGIRFVLNMADFSLRAQRSIFDFRYRSRDLPIKYQGFNASDNLQYDISKHFDDTFAFISKARECNEKILVHCAMGISRSSAIVTAYLMRANAWSFATALQYVRERRSIVQPNPNFCLQLRALEKTLIKEGVLTVPPQDGSSNPVGQVTGPAEATSSGAAVEVVVASLPQSGDSADAGDAAALDAEPAVAETGPELLQVET